jgi:hypothetical protein
MFVKVLGVDRPVALDGQTITIWPVGSVQECSSDFAAPLLRDKWVRTASDAEVKAARPPAPDKPAGDENKASDGGSENK